MVDSGKMDKDNRQAEFFKNPEGKYAIPGNTMRGLIRTNCQIISSSPVSDEIEDQQFLFRDIASNTYLSDKYKETLGIKGRGIARNLKVGYMERKNGRYYIRESERLDDDYPYLDVKELDLHKGLGLNLDKTNLMYKRNILKDEAKIKDLNKKIGRAIFAKGRKNWGEINSNRRTRDRIISSHRNRNFTPYYKEVSFDYDRKKRRITRISKPGDCQYNGYLLSGNYILGKMAHYIVPAPLENMGEVEVDERSIEAYKNDLVITKKADKTSQGVRIKKGDEYYDLPAEGEIKPVFYINSQTGFHFGFTPNLRIMYPASVHDGVEESYMAGELISYTDAIFGFINKGRNKESYKGRVNFTDLITEDGRVDKEAAIDLILAGPKPTSFNLYLEQDSDKYGKNWANIYEGDFSLAGFKKYWLKDYIENPNLEDANKNMTFTINPLEAGTEFKGRIYFDNLRAEELGLLLYSIRLRQGSNQNIGMAKPYAYGRIEFTDISFKIEDLDTKYGGFNFYYHKLANVDQYIDKFKTSFSQEF